MIYMENAIVRKAKLEDIDNGLLKAYIDGYRFHQNGRPDIFSNMSDEELKNKLLKDFDRLEILVALNNDVVVGYIAYEIKEKSYKKMYIDQLAISNEFKKQGFGKQLIDEIIKNAKENDCKRIEFNCWMFNENALAIYDHLGFKRQRIMYEIDL